MSSVTMVQSQIAQGKPYSRGVKVCNLLFTHGQTGVDLATMKLAPGGIGPETTMTLKRLQMILEAGGTSLEHVVKVTVYMADLAEWDEFNKSYAPFFQKHQPARTVMTVPYIDGGARIEMDMVAALGDP